MPGRAVAIRHLLVDTVDQAGNSISPGLFTTLLFNACACSHDLVPARRAADGAGAQRFGSQSTAKGNLAPLMTTSPRATFTVRKVPSVIAAMILSFKSPRSTELSRA
jgi:hypothetical protein